MGHMPRVFVILLNWNWPQDTIECIRLNVILSGLLEVLAFSFAWCQVTDEFRRSSVTNIVRPIQREGS